MRIPAAGKSWLIPPATAILLALALAAQAQDTEQPPRPEPRAVAPAQTALTEPDPQVAARLFAMPRIIAATRSAVEEIQAGDPEAAARILDAWIARYPRDGGLRTSRAALAMLTGDRTEALEQLKEAVTTGGLDMRDVADDPLLSPLAGDPELGADYAALLRTPPSEPPHSAEPAPLTETRAPVTAANTTWNPASERLEPRFSFPDAPFGPVLPSTPKSAAYEILREHARQDRAAGNHGDLYDNRDRGHSALRPEAHPQLTHVVYGDAAKKAGTDYGLAGEYLFDRPTLGNSSTAFTNGPFWRSQPRYAMTSPDGTGPMRIWQEASANHLYIYPSHKDFTEKNGDLFPANSPHILISHGSSYSDKPFMEAVAMILAAFTPETKERLIAENMIVPTVQMVFRRSLQNVRSRGSYFSGAAHPAVFAGHQINLARMVSLANAITPDTIPAEVRFRVETEELGVEGIDFFGQGLSERLFDTPASIARIWRSKTGRRTMILDAGDSRDINGNPLEFSWSILQGDPEKITIEPLEDGQKARITIDWHDPFQISDEVRITTSRVDIGVFAHNGTHDSAPAILSWYFPAHQKRTYATAPDGTPRITSIDHMAPSHAEVHADPQLFAGMDWRDEFKWDPDGTSAGWTRYRGERQDDYTEAGERILTRHPDGTPQRTEPVAHVLRRSGDGTLVTDELSGGR
ncbi:bacterial transcriptional activator domain-containing protein [Amaricoccus tamworthensis]|uniref:bacterial transcriptional activator domain-containing protein n=1 Tax=Amaricoccus tamworthensis TaxID=57002 RepID=UPI003C79E6DB